MHSLIHGELARVLAAEKIQPHLAAERPRSARRWRWRRRSRHASTWPQLSRSRT